MPEESVLDTSGGTFHQRASAGGPRWRCCARLPRAPPPLRQRCTTAPRPPRPKLRRRPTRLGAARSSTWWLTRPPTARRHPGLRSGRRGGRGPEQPPPAPGDGAHGRQPYRREGREADEAVALIKGLLDDGFHPIVFCRFIPTADYVAAELRARLPRGVEVVPVTGLLPPAERGGARGAGRGVAQAGPRGHGLPVGRHQPAGGLRRRRAL